jgi:uncharacterized protein YndB with AHSA1/START domain
MEFFGRYIEVTPHSRLVWTNDEGGEGGAVTTVTFEERGAGFSETFEQLDEELLVTLGASVGRS